MTTTPLPEPVAHCHLSIGRKSIACFDGKHMFMPGPIGNEPHPDPLYTADQMHAHAAAVTADLRAEIERLKREDAALNNLLYWVERAVDKGNANSDIEESWNEYDAALKESN